MPPQEGLTLSNWISIASIVTPVVFGFVGWLTYMAMTVGKISQKIDNFSEVTTKLQKEVDNHNAFELRIVKLEAAIAIR